MLLLVIFILVVVGTIVSCQWIYRLIAPYLKSEEGRSFLLKGFAIMILLAGVMYAFVRYELSEPAYFEQGIEQLHTSKYIQNRIGSFSSYTFNENKIFKEPKSPAVFQVEIDSDSLNLFLTCTMTSVKDKWHLSKIREDSTHTNH